MKQNLNKQQTCFNPNLFPYTRHLDVPITSNLTYCHQNSSLHSPTHPSTHPHTHALTHPHTHARTHARTRSLTHSLTRALTHSLTHSLAHSLTHSLTHSRTHLTEKPGYFAGQDDVQLPRGLDLVLHHLLLILSLSHHLYKS